MTEPCWTRVELQQVTGLTENRLRLICVADAPKQLPPPPPDPYTVWRKVCGAMVDLVNHAGNVPARLGIRVEYTAWFSDGKGYSGAFTLHGDDDHPEALFLANLLWPPDSELTPERTALAQQIREGRRSLGFSEHERKFYAGIFDGPA